jgi:hypothetical protein
MGLVPEEAVEMTSPQRGWSSDALSMLSTNNPYLRERSGSEQRWVEEMHASFL